MQEKKSTYKEISANSVSPNKDSIKSGEKDENPASRNQDIKGDDSMSGLIIDEFESSTPLLNKIPVKKTVRQEPVKKNIPQKKDDLTIKLPNEVKTRIPRDFNLNVIGSIDLGEAEKIAKEDILFLTENDLIEGLEEFDLIPLRKDIPDNHEVERVASTGLMQKKEPDVIVQDDYSEESSVEVHEAYSDTLDEEPHDESFDEMDEESAAESGAEQETDSVLLEQENSEEPIVNESLNEERLRDIDEDDDLFLKPLIVDDERPVKRHVSPAPVKGHEGSIVHDLVLEELDDDRDHDKVIKRKFIRPEESSLRDAESPEDSDLIPVASSGKQSFTAEEIPGEDLIFIGQEKQTFVKEEPGESAGNERDADYDNLFSRVEKEIIPDELRVIEKINENVLFIDDEIIERDSESKISIFDENRLEAITPDVMEVSESRVKILEEADKEKDREKIAQASSVSYGTTNDILLEFEDDEYKYKDDELDFVDNAIFEDDYSRYVREIDDLYGTQGPKQVSVAQEIFGLNNEDLGLIEERLFFEEYKNVNLDEIFSLIKTGFSPFSAYDGSERYCNYILPDAESFYEVERRSIEADISARGALIFEEDVSLIRKKLGREVDDVAAEAVEISEAVHDITDKIVIIEDDLDVDRFIREFPDEQQTDVKKLLKYLDGLFEKLPEDVVKKFASSEYFDLYVNVLNEMGV